MFVERMEGVLIMAANTKALPRMDMSISGALRTQFIMVTVLGVKLSSLFECWSAILKLKSDQLIVKRKFQGNVETPISRENHSSNQSPKYFAFFCCFHCW